MKKAVLAEYLSSGLSLEQIGILENRHPSTISYWLKKHGLKAVHHDANAPKGGIARERLEELVEAGGTIRSIAEELERSDHTVCYWLRKHGLKTKGLRGNSRPFREAKAAGIRTVMGDCRRHGHTKFVLEGRGYYRCGKCRIENVTEWRRRTKRRLAEEAGGRCAICGYDKHPAALQFHHLDPATKEFPLSVKGATKSLAKLRQEAAKCVLLCGNCHAEVEVGAATVNSPSESESEV